MYTIIGRNECQFCLFIINMIKNRRKEYTFLDIKTFDKESSLWSDKPKTHLNIPIVYYDNKYIGCLYNVCSHIMTT